MKYSQAWGIHLDEQAETSKESDTLAWPQFLL